MHLMSMPPAGGFEKQAITKSGQQSLPIGQEVVITGWAADPTWPGTPVTTGLEVVGAGQATITIHLECTQWQTFIDATIWHGTTKLADVRSTQNGMAGQNVDWTGTASVDAGDVISVRCRNALFASDLVAGSITVTPV